MVLICTEGKHEGSAASVPTERRCSTVSRFYPTSFCSVMFQLAAKLPLQPSKTVLEAMRTSSSKGCWDVMLFCLQRALPRLVAVKVDVVTLRARHDGSADHWSLGCLPGRVRLLLLLASGAAVPFVRCEKSSNHGLTSAALFLPGEIRIRSKRSLRRSFFSLLLAPETSRCVQALTTSHSYNMLQSSYHAAKRPESQQQFLLPEGHRFQ